MLSSSLFGPAMFRPGARLGLWGGVFFRYYNNTT